MTPRRLLARAVALAVAAAGAGSVEAHELAGKRLFPTTLAVETPFVADELTLPSVLHIKRPASDGEPARRETRISGEWTKRITSDLGLALEGEWLHLDPDGRQSHSGFGNLGIGLKYQLIENGSHEFILSAGFGLEVGGTGRRAVGAESFDVLQPALFFGKGMGDLPDSLAYLKPLGVTGMVGALIPTRHHTRKLTTTDDGVDVEFEKHPDVFQWGLAVHYSIPYLQAFVRDLGLTAPLNRLFPVVEVAFQHPLNRGQSGRSTGTVNPGIIWSGRWVEIGLEAVIPVNERTGKNVGVRALLNIELDDLFPTTVGRPLFGK